MWQFNELECVSVWSLSRDGVLVSSCMFAEASVLHGEMQPEVATQRRSPHLVFSPPHTAARERRRKWSCFRSLTLSLGNSKYFFSHLLPFSVIWLEFFQCLTFKGSFSGWESLTLFGILERIQSYSVICPWAVFSFQSYMSFGIIFVRHFFFFL